MPERIGIYMAAIEKIERFKLAEATLNEVFNLSHAIGKTAIEANDVGKIANDYIEQVGAIVADGHEFITSTLLAYGTDVLTPDVNIIRKDATVSFDMDKDKPQRSVVEVEPVTGRYHSIAVVLNDVDNSDKKRIEPIMILASDYDGVDVTMNGAPFASYTRTEYSQVPLRKRADAKLAIAGMEEIRKQSDAVNVLSRKALGKSVFKRKLRALNEAFLHEESNYVELANTRILRSLGSEGKAHITADESSTDYILDALISTIGKDRQLKLETDLLYTLKDSIPEPHEGTCIGSVIDVCADLSGINSSSLMIVLSSNRGYLYIPLANVRKLWF